MIGSRSREVVGGPGPMGNQSPTFNRVHSSYQLSQDHPRCLSQLRYDFFVDYDLLPTSHDAIIRCCTDPKKLATNHSQPLRDLFKRPPSLFTIDYTIVCTGSCTCITMAKIDVGDLSTEFIVIHNPNFEQHATQKEARGIS